MLSLSVKSFFKIFQEVICQLFALLLEKHKCVKPVICLVLMFRATTSYTEMLKHFAVCISEYRILCGMHILLICLVHVVDEVHLCVQMWTHICKIHFFFFWKEEISGNKCKVSYGPFPALD